MARVLVALTILSIASVGAAAPIISATVDDLGGGMYGFTVNINMNDGKVEPIWAELTYYGYDTATHSGTYGPGVDGQLYNVLSPIKGTIPPDYDANVHYEPDADVWNVADPSYTKANDSWVCEEFCHSIKAQTGGVHPDNWFYIDSGNEAGVYYLAADHMYLVSDGYIVYEGRVGRTDLWQDVSGVLVPEPAALLLLAAGGVGLILRRRR
jgi:hypothetical protein